jgi:hypothetical protein
MNMMEMLLALLAVVFFTSVAANYNRKILDQNDYLINATQYVQATQLCHTVLDEVDSKLFAKMIAFYSVKTTYANLNRTIDLAFPGDVYQLNIRAVDCDSLGIPLATPVTNNIWVRIRVTATTPGLKVPVTLQRVYTKTHLNL